MNSNMFDIIVRAEITTVAFSKTVIFFTPLSHFLQNPGSFLPILRYRLFFICHRFRIPEEVSLIPLAHLRERRSYRSDDPLLIFIDGRQNFSSPFCCLWLHYSYA